MVPPLPWVFYPYDFVPYAEAWLDARGSFWLARMPRSDRVRRPRRLHATLAAVPVLFAPAFGPCHMKKTYGFTYSIHGSVY
jgi:hypothetical protein